MEQNNHCTIYKEDDKTDYSNYRDNFTFVKYIQNFIQHPAVKVNSICTGNYWGLSMWILKQQVNKLWITYSVFAKYLRKKWEYNDAVHQLFIDFKQAHD
jgi:hypothetical protein